MYYISSVLNGSDGVIRYGITDTKDGVEEFYTRNQVLHIVANLKVNVNGVTLLGSNRCTIDIVKYDGKCTLTKDDICVKVLLSMAGSCETFFKMSENSYKVTTRLNNRVLPDKDALNFSYNYGDKIHIALEWKNSELFKDCSILLAYDSDENKYLIRILYMPTATIVYVNKSISNLNYEIACILHLIEHNMGEQCNNNYYEQEILSVNRNLVLNLVYTLRVLTELDYTYNDIHFLYGWKKIGIEDIEICENTFLSVYTEPKWLLTAPVASYLTVDIDKNGEVFRYFVNFNSIREDTQKVRKELKYLLRG